MSVDEATPAGPAAPPRSQRPRWRRMVPPALVLGGLTAATTALHFRDPHVEGSWGICPSAALGFWCPGCGGLRATNDLSNGEIVDAASSNLLFVLWIPVIAYVFARWSIARWQGRPYEISLRATNITAIVLVAGLVVFTVLRNLPAGAWLAP